MCAAGVHVAAASGGATTRGTAILAKPVPGCGAARGMLGKRQEPLEEEMAVKRSRESERGSADAPASLGAAPAPASGSPPLPQEQAAQIQSLQEQLAQMQQKQREQQQKLELEQQQQLAQLKGKLHQLQHTQASQGAPPPSQQQQQQQQEAAPDAPESAAASDDGPARATSPELTHDELAHGDGADAPDAPAEAADAPRSTSPAPSKQFATAATDGEMRICFPFLNRGFCQYGESCKYRHLAQDHPDAIADRLRTGYTERLVGLAISRDGEATKAAPPAVPSESSDSAGPSARICFPYLNHGKCDREGTCRFRHLAQDHPDAVADRMRTGDYDKIPRHVNPMIDQNPNAQPTEQRICYSFLNKGSCAREGCTFRHLLPAHPDAVADRVRNGQVDKLPDYVRRIMAQQQQQQPAAPARHPPAPAGYGGYGGYPTPPAQYAAPYAAYPSAPIAPQPPHASGQQAAPGEQRICFPYLNTGVCQRGNACKFRHLAPDHPDAIADRLRRGRVPATPARQQGAQQPPHAQAHMQHPPAHHQGVYEHDAHAAAGYGAQHSAGSYGDASYGAQPAGGSYGDAGQMAAAGYGVQQQAAYPGLESYGAGSYGGVSQPHAGW